MNKFGYIYKTTDKRNNLNYVGKRIGKFKNNYYGSGVLIRPIIKKYGYNIFSRKILDYASNNRDLNNKEKFW